MNPTIYVILTQTSPEEFEMVATAANANIARYIAQGCFVKDVDWWRNIVLNATTEKEIASWEFRKETEERFWRRNTSPGAQDSEPELFEVQRMAGSGQAIMRCIDDEPDDESSRN